MKPGDGVEVDGFWNVLLLKRSTCYLLTPPFCPGYIYPRASVHQEVGTECSKQQ